MELLPHGDASGDGSARVFSQSASGGEPCLFHIGHRWCGISSKSLGIAPNGFFHVISDILVGLSGWLEIPKGTSITSVPSACKPICHSADRPSS